MKRIIFFLVSLVTYSNCTQQTKTTNTPISDGFYEVIALPTANVPQQPLGASQKRVPFDIHFAPDSVSEVIVDTADYVPLQLEKSPTLTQQTGQNKLLSVSLSPFAAKKLEDFTARRIMKQVVVVLDGKAISMHKIRDTIKGGQLQITRCGDNACEYLYIKMKNKVIR